MAWCPVCKLEYVKGIEVCPDCKAALVDSMEEVEYIDKVNQLNELKEQLNGLTPEEYQQSMMAEQMAMQKRFMENPPYKSVAEELESNKSGIGVLLGSGLVGVIVLLLNAFGVIHLPFYGFGLTLLNTVMGILFFVFIVSGIRCIFKANSLKAAALKEKEDIEKIVAFLKETKANGGYRLKEGTPYEVGCLAISEKAVDDINKAFPDLIPGFSFWVVERYGNELFDED